jgi:hypothetical protein
MRRYKFAFLSMALFSTILFVGPDLLGDTGAPSGPSAGAATIEITVAPERLVLGQTTDAVVSATVRTQSGESLACEDIHIHASQGDVAQLSQIGVGEYTAKYVLPSDFFPRFALIAASAVCADKTITGSTVVALYGAGNVDMRFEPRTEVVLEIAGERFGPYETDDKGMVNIPMVVPPGVQTGVVGGKTIDLNLPQANRIVAIPEKRRAREGAGAETVIIIYAIDDKSGKPLTKARLKVKPEKGTISEIVPAAPGVYQAYYKPPDGAVFGQDNVSISLRGDAVSETSLAIQLASGIPARIVINIHPKAYRASADTPLNIAVRLTDEKGNPTAGEVIASSDFGELAELRELAPGEYRTSLRLPNNFEGRSKAHITAQLPKNIGVIAEATVKLVAAEPTAIAFEPVAKPIPADGVSTTGIPFKLLDQFGNFVPMQEVAIAAALGTTPPLATADQDRYLVPFTPPFVRGRKTKDSAVRASIGDVHAETKVPLTTRRYLMAVTPSFGFLTSMDGLNAPYFSAPIDWSFWFALPGLHLGLDFGYYFDKDATSPSRVIASVHALVFGLFVGYRIYVIPKLFLSPLFSLGALFIWSEVRQEATGDLTDNAGQLYVRGVLEMGYRLGPGHIVLKLAYLHANTDKIQSFDGRIGGLSIHAGYRFELF